MEDNQQIFKILTFITEPNLQDEILKNSKIISVNTGDIVIEGVIRVFQTKEDREILLYYVEPSQTCMMSLSASFFNHSSAIEAIATEPTKILAIPTKYIIEWQKIYTSWNHFVITTFRKRYDELLSAFESVAFDRIDKRVLEYLNYRKEKEKTSAIKISHLQLAKELGTTRVVISRILKQFEIEKKLKLHRGIIELF